MGNTGVVDVAMMVHVYVGVAMCIGNGGQIGSDVSGEDTRADIMLGGGGDTRLFCMSTSYDACRRHCVSECQAP